MLSTKTLSSSGSAGHYYLGEDNYYVKEKEALSHSEWHGKGASLLGLSGTVDPTVFKDLLNGRLPNGRQLGKQLGDGKVAHRAGFDLTFSAVKSASVAGLVLGEKDMQAAHIASVKMVTDYIEKQCAQVRVTQDGITDYQLSNNLTIALFHHDLSRTADPAIHTHAVVMNASCGEDGKFRALASSLGKYGKSVDKEVNGFIERVRHNKHFYGALYRHEYAHQLKKMGYAIEVKPDGFFKVKGVPDDLCDAFSQRRQEITQRMQEKGVEGGKAASIATLETRPSKQGVDRDALIKIWEKTCQSLGYSVDEIKQSVKQEGLHPTKTVSKHNAIEHKMIDGLDIPKTKNETNIQKNTVNTKAKEAINYAIRYLSEKKAVLSENNIINSAAEFALGEPVGIQALTQAFEAVKQTDTLIPLAKASTQSYFITQAQLQTEKDLLVSIHEGMGDYKRLGRADKTRAFLCQQTQLSAHQRQRINTLFSSKDHITGLVGQVGSGKTTLMQPIAALAQSEGYQVIALSQDRGEVKQLENTFKSHPKSFVDWIKGLFHYQSFHTVSGFLNQQAFFKARGYLNTAKKLIVVDNAHRLDAKTLLNLTTTAKGINARVVLIGDQKAESLSQDNSFSKIMASGIQVSTLKQMYHQKNTALHQVVRETLKGNINKAFDKVGDALIEIEDQTDCFKTIAQQFGGLKPAARDRTLVIMPSKASCLSVNQMIHQQLVEKGESKSGFSTQTLTSVFLKPAEFERAKNYRVGQLLRFNQGRIPLPMEKGDYLTIKYVDHRNNELVLVNHEGKQCRWSANRMQGKKTGSLEVFSVEQREFAVGEKVTWQRNDWSRKIDKGEDFTIINKIGQRIILENENKKLSLNLEKNADQHIEYGYAKTFHAASQQRPDQVIAYQKSNTPQAQQKRFYGLLTKAKQAAFIYTDNKQTLLENVKTQLGESSTIIETLLKGTQVAHYLKAVNDPKVMLEQLESIVSDAIKTQKNMQIKDEPLSSKQIAEKAISHAVLMLSEREAAFQVKEVLHHAMGYALGDVSIKALQVAYHHALKKGELLSQQGQSPTLSHYVTTPAAVSQEKEVLALFKQDQGKLTPIMDQTSVDAQFAKTHLTDQQADAAKAILTTKDRLILLQGSAGVGKTTLLVDVKAKAEAQGYHILGLAPTHKAVKELSNRGITATTIEGFLNERNTQSLIKSHQKNLIFVDESSMISNDRMVTLQQKIHTLNARAVMIGDKDQLPAPPSGKPFALQQAADPKRIQVVNKIIRQQTPHLLKAVEATVHKDIDLNFSLLKNDFIEVNAKNYLSNDEEGKALEGSPKNTQGNTTTEVVSELYLKKSKAERDNTLVITATHADKASINQSIRTGLLKEGTLTGTEMQTTFLKGKHLTQLELSQAMQYEKGDQIRFNTARKSMGISRGDYLTVLSADQTKNQLVLGKQTGEECLLQLDTQNIKQSSKGLEVYTPTSSTLQAGDKIRWTRSDKHQGILGAMTATVKAVGDQTATVTLENGKDKKIDFHDPKQRHIEYGYALTTHATQGVSEKNVIFCAHSYNKLAMTQKNWFVGISRVVESLTIVTDNKDALLYQIKHTTGDKHSALEALGEVTPNASVDKRITPRQSSINEHHKTRTQSAGAKEKENSIKASQTKQQSSFSMQEETKQIQDKKVHHAPNFVEINAVIKALNEDAERITKTMLGTPKNRTSNHYVYSHSEVLGGERGKGKGSFYVAISGNKQGCWHSFKTGEGGSLLQLIQKVYSLPFKESIDAACKLLGMQKAHFQDVSLHRKAPEQINKEAIKEHTQDELKRIRFAQKLARESKPIQGTIAEAYLKKHRGIDIDVLPKSLRFHPNIYSGINQKTGAALLSIAKNSKGEIQAVQATFLDKKTQNKAQNLEVGKQTFGVVKGAFVDMTAQERVRTTVFAEGVETGLSITQAMPDVNVKVSLGKSNFKNIDTNTVGNAVILCPDNDGKDIKEDRIIKGAVDNLTGDKERSIFIAMPEKKGKDYNDFLIEKGEDKIRDSLLDAQEKTSYFSKETGEVTHRYRDQANLNQGNKVEEKPEVSSL